VLPTPPVGHFKMATGAAAAAAGGGLSENGYGQDASSSGKTFTTPFVVLTY
jgi:hypothetical protein